MQPASNAQPPSASALTAASSAFLNHRSSNASLAAAAAGAALRSRPTTPINVAQVQTKRMVRRSSNSSAGSAAGSLRERPGSQLERRGSAGSMSERTFRDPSPGRGSPVPHLADAPPVPAIPKNIQTKAHRRAASAEAPAMRIASPPPNKATGRGSSLGPTGGQPPAARGRQRVTSLSSVQEQTSYERPESRGSVNFSYPVGARVMSPYGQRKLTDSLQSASQRNSVQQKPNLVYDPNTRSFLPESQILFQQQRIEDAAERPVKKKKRVAPQGAAGTHLAAGTVGRRPHGTAVTALEAADTRSMSPVTSSAPAPAAAPTAVPHSTTSPQTAKSRAEKNTVKVDTSADNSGLSDAESDTSERPQFQTRAGMLLARKPSVIPEHDEENEDDGDLMRTSSRQAALEKLESGNTIDRVVSPTPQSQITAGKGHGQKTTPAPVETLQQSRSTSQPPATLGVKTNGYATGSIRHDRVQSASPSRTAHFSQTPEFSNLSVRHDPLPRSSSPRKSALKQSPSPRGPSPIDGSGVSRRSHGSVISEASDTSTNFSEGTLPVPKKKAARVSFDDDSNIVLGETTTTTVEDTSAISHQHRKKGWFGKGKKASSSVFDDDDDSVMTPRPALPAFGSVRGKKSLEFEERSLVQLSDPRETTPPPSPILTTSTGERLEYPQGSSLDHGIGAVLAQDHNVKTKASILEAGELLPPEVTSVDGSGYHSDESGTSTAEIEPQTTNATTPFTSTIINGETPDISERPVTPPTNAEHIEKHINGSVPVLAITEATPILEAQSEFFEMPGGFPSNVSDSGTEDHEHDIVGHHVTDPTPAAAGISEPEPVNKPSGSPTIGSIAAENRVHSPIIEESEASDRDSIYSDAAEDLSDLEGDGFMSLDAVLDSPIPPPSLPPSANTALPESPTDKHVKEKAYRKSQLSRQSSQPDIDQGWDKAQAYWAGLTTEKKRELEQQALEKSGGDSVESETDLVTPQPASKPVSKRKKKVVVASPGEEPDEPGPAVSSYKTDRTYQITPGQKAAADSLVPSLRSSMRAPAPSTADDGHMRKTMRNGAASGGSSMRSSMRGSSSSAQISPPAEPRGSLQKKYRPMSYPPPEMTPDPIVTKKPPRNLSVGAAAAASTKPSVKPSVPALRRSNSDASDSSFQRARPSNDGYTMRTSMRGSSSQTRSGRPQSPEASQLRSSRFSLRSLSPTGSTYRRPFSSSSAQTPPSITGLGRTTMRNRAYSNDSNAPTLRSARQDRVKSPLPSFGFGKSKPAPRPKTAPPKRASRFGDSSDEEDDRPAYRSRFADSSDEEDSAPVRAPPQGRTNTMRSAPARTIPPQRTGAVDGDSSDLPDTDDEKRPAPKPAISPTSTVAGTTLRRSGSGRDFIGNPGTIPSVGGDQAPRTEQKRRGSFMSMLRRKKTDEESKVRKSTLDSAARRDTPLERSRTELDAMKRQDSSYSATNGRPKLQKRNTGSYAAPALIKMPADWPLGGVDEPLSSQMKDSEGRPMTSDGISPRRTPSGSLRPSTGSRRVTATGMPAFESPDGGPHRKKKKFGMLRKAFGLDL